MSEEDNSSNLNKSIDRSYESVDLDESPLPVSGPTASSSITSLMGQRLSQIEKQRFSLIQIRGKEEIVGRRRSNTDPSVSRRPKFVKKKNPEKSKKKKWILNLKLFGCKRESFSEEDEQESIVGILREQLKNFEEEYSSEEENGDNDREGEDDMKFKSNLWENSLEDDEEEGEDEDYIVVETPTQERKIERIVYDNGSKYVGNVDDRGRRNGRGKLTYSNGDLYDGEWLHDWRHGAALCVFANHRMILNFSTHYELNEPSSRYLTHITYKNGDKFIGHVKVISERINTNIVRNAPHLPVQTKFLEPILRSGRGEIYWANRSPANGEQGSNENNGNSSNIDRKTIPFTSVDNKEKNTIRSKYSGSWQNDAMNGWGMIIYKCFSCPPLKGVPRSEGSLGMFGRSRKRERAEEYYYGDFKRNKREGRGLQVYYDGSRYEGEFKGDRRYGKGVFQLASGDVIEGVWRGDNLKNGTFHKGSVTTSPTSSAFILHHHLKQRMREDSSFQHLTEVTYPESRLLSRRKWLNFFLERKMDHRIKREKKRVGGSTFSLFFARKKDSLIRGKPSFDKFNHQSFINYMYQDLSLSMEGPRTRLMKAQKSNNSSSSSSESKKSSMSLPLHKQASSLKKDSVSLSLGKPTFSEKLRNLEGGFLYVVVSEFRDFFNFRYCSISPESCHVQLPFALDDVFSFISQLNRVCVEVYTPEITKCFGVKRLFSVVKQYVLSRIYKFLFELYKFKYAEDDAKFAFKLKSIFKISMLELGCKTHYIPTSNLFAEPYEKVFDKFRELSTQQCPSHKFAVLVDVHKELNSAMEIIDKESKERGADEIFPVYLYCFIKANIPNVFSQFRFMLDFSDVVVHNSELYYRFTNFENALNYIGMLDNRVRDRGDCLITPSVLLQRMEFAIDQIQKERKRANKTNLNLSWLSGGLIKISNHYKLEKGQMIDFNDFFSCIEETGYEYVKAIFELLGLKMMRVRKKMPGLLSTVDDEDEEEVEGEEEEIMPLEQSLRFSRKLKKKPLSWTDMDTKSFRGMEEVEFVKNAVYSYKVYFEHSYPSHVYYQVASNLDLIL